jgi:asparagine synthase (glutamine-hydrolysing)
MNIVGCVGLSPELRHSYLSSVDAGIRVFDWLHVGRWELPSAGILCAVNSLSRVRVERAEREGRLHMGSSVTDGGLYVSVLSRDDGSCSVHVDPLGLFPLYYYSTPEFFLFSSSQWAFEKHPNGPRELDLDGLIGIFLSQGIVGGRTLNRDVTRLSAGYCVTWEPGRLAVERRFNRLTPTSDLFNATFDEQRDALDAALLSATTRDDSGKMLLSGGLDSRLVAGYVGSARGRDVEAVTLGSSEQFDSAFARRVAERLGWRHRSIAVDMSQFCTHAAIQTRHEQLGASFADLAFWQLVTELSGSDPALMTGFCGNNVLEPLRHDPRQTEFAFAGAFNSCNKYGFSPAMLGTLLRGNGVEDRIAAVVERLRDEYESFDGEPFQKTLMFDLSHRARFLIGAVVWRLSFGMQPILPYADPAVLRTALGLPVMAFRDRKLQKAVLCRRFPELARLPLDTATFFTRPLMPTVADRVRHLSLLAYHGLISRNERRYYHSVFDLNGPGWRAVRAQAETSRSRVESILDREVLRKLLPPPNEAITTSASDFFHMGSRTKSLLAFMMWASERL